jgi:hypothetical protein
MLPNYVKLISSNAWSSSNRRGVNVGCGDPEDFAFPPMDVKSNG